MKISNTQIAESLESPSPEWRSRRGLRDAAVLIAFVELEGSDSIVYQQRRADLPHHGGQVAFPGGAREGGEDALTCALRETHEECGLGNDRFEILGRLPARVSLAGFQVQSFVARLDSLDGSQPDPREVEELFAIPVAELMRDDRWNFKERVPWAVMHRSPYFPYDGKMLWGLSALITRELLSRVCR